jgi:hypothetical protein
MIGAWIGYLLLGFSLPHHISTHDYYHLPLFILICIGSASFIPKIVVFFKSKNSWIQSFGIIALFFLFSTYLLDSRSLLKNANYSDEVEFWQELGQKFEVDERVLSLSEDYGNRLAYWGWKTPKNWPSKDDIKLRQDAGFDLELEDYFIDYANGFDYFLITDFEELGKQPQLLDWLENNYQLIQKDDQLILFDLSSSNNRPDS